MIRLIPKNEVYIGQSKNISERMQAHRTTLRNNRNRYRDGQYTVLQKAWNKYGEENFEFKIIEICDEKELDEREKYWISYYKCNKTKSGKGFNLTDGGYHVFSSNANNKGKVLINDGNKSFFINRDELDKYLDNGYKKGASEKAKEERIKKYWLTHTKKEKPKKQPKQRKTLSDEHKRKISESLRKLNRKVPIEHIEKIRKICSAPVEQYTKDGRFLNSFLSMAEAEEKTHIGKSHICQVCKGKRKTAGGYIWKYGNKNV